MSYSPNNPNGQATSANSAPVVIASNQSAVPVSGTVTVTQATGTNLHTVVDSSTLPSGASTSALQTQISGQLPTTLGAKTTANSLAVNIASDQTVPVSGPLTNTQLRATAVPVELAASIGGSAFSSTNYIPSRLTNGTVYIDPSASTVSSGSATASSTTQIAGTDGTNTHTIKTSATGVVIVDGSAVTQPVSGTVTATNVANGATGATVPAQATQVAGSDGTNLRAIKVSSTGVVSVDGSAVTQPVSATNLSTNIAQLAGTTTAVNNGTASAGTLRVAIASDNTSNTNPFLVQANRSATATLTNVAASASSVSILASNANRKGAMVYNDSTAILYLKFGTTASTSSFTVLMVAGSYYELPPSSIYTGAIDGIWASATGNARITELT